MARGRPVLPNTRIPDFVKWSESEAGFYPGTFYRNGDWFPSRKPIKWEPHQARLLSWVFKPNSKGKFPVDTLFYVDVAKSGKTMIGAAVAQYFGMFVDIDVPGEIIIAANSKDHAGVRTFGTLKRALANHPFIEDIVEGGLTGINDTGIRFKDSGHVCRAIPKKASTQAGSDAVFLDFDEVWDLRGEAAKQFVAEMKPSFTRNVSFRMFHSYPGYHGDEGFLTRALADFYDEDGNPKPEAQKVEGLEDLPLHVIGRTALWWNHNPFLYRWITKDTMAEVERQYKHFPNEIQRIYYARVVQATDALFPPEVWYRLTDNDWQGARPDRGKREAMVGAMDLATVDDSCGVVFRGYDPDTDKMPLMSDREFKPKDYRTEITGHVLGEVKQHILDMHKKYNVLAVGYDPSQAIWMVNELIKAGVNMIPVNQNKEREIADTNYRQCVYDGRLRNYPHCGALTQHALAAIAEVTGHKTLRIRKDKSTKKIDVLVADSMCVHVAQQYKDQLARLARNDGKPAWRPQPSMWDIPRR